MAATSAPIRRPAIVWAAPLILGLVAGLGLAAPAAADDLEDQKAALAGQVSEAQTSLDGASAQFEAAAARVETAAALVSEAQGVLDQAQADLAEARALDAKKAAELTDAQAAYHAAAAQENNGRIGVQKERDQLSETARAAFQQNSDLVSFATVLNPANSTADLSNRLQWAENAVAVRQASLDRLEEIQRSLAVSRQNTAVAQAKADLAKQAAAAQVADTEAKEQAAQTAKDALDAALAEEVAAKAQAQTELEASQQRLAELEAERDRVNAEIARRAEEARKAEEARQAEEARRAAANNNGGAQYPAAGAVSSSGLANPVPGAFLTSPFGYRINPISGRSELHDGTDLGAGCGTPIRAAAAGTVTQAYYNSGYGNRIFVDHGYVNGQHLVTSYNHMSGFAASPGQWVSQGQVIGYVGTTGYSTGCHLHFILWVNGSLTNAWPYIS